MSGRNSRQGHSRNVRGSQNPTMNQESTDETPAPPSGETPVPSSGSGEPEVTQPESGSTEQPDTNQAADDTSDVPPASV